MRAVGQRVLIGTADTVALGHLLGGLPHGQAGGIFGHSRRHRQEIFKPQTANYVPLLSQGAGLVEIDQGMGQLAGHPDRQHRGGVRAPGYAYFDIARHDRLGNIDSRLKTGGTGTGNTVGICVQIHAGTQDNFTGNIGRCRHLYDLAVDKLLNQLGVQFTATEQLIDHHLAHIQRRYAVKRRRLFGERGTQTCHYGNPLAPGIGYLLSVTHLSPSLQWRTPKTGPDAALYCFSIRDPYCPKQV